MSTKKRASRLGRGLSSLMSKPVQVETAPPTADETPHEAATAVVKPAAVEVQTDTAESPADIAPTNDVSRGTDSNIATSEAEQSSTELAETVAEQGNQTATNMDTQAAKESGMQYLPVSAIVPNRHQPRQDFDETALKGLSESIKRDGLIQPIMVRKIDGAVDGEAAYELVAGERRWRASKLAGLETIPGFVRELDEKQLAELALIENLQREDLNPIERAEAFKRLADTFDLSHEQVADRVGVERPTISNHLRLLSLCDDVRTLIRAGALSMGQARALAGLMDEASQIALARQAIKEAWSVRQMEAAVRKLAAGAPKPQADDTKETAKARRSAQMADLEKHLSEQLSTKIKIRPGRKKGAGTLSIEFYSVDQFDELVAKLGGNLE
ncbi:ParB/RepB/Spo0J family partition protein [Poriferisphaera sp. WC338]|uniref:ParB/RepB/Spo0J family partition protein n=1 Tax=Poriferisphaera sp. WC338 TaxID=3425129 RepID=UPI003D81917E